MELKIDLLTIQFIMYSDAEELVYASSKMKHLKKHITSCNHLLISPKYPLTRTSWVDLEMRELEAESCEKRFLKNYLVIVLAKVPKCFESFLQLQTLLVSRFLNEL